MPADKMPKMPLAPTADAVLGPLYSRHDLQAYGRACYLAGIEAARGAVESCVKDDDGWIYPPHIFDNLDALGRE